MIDHIFKIAARDALTRAQHHLRQTYPDVLRHGEHCRSCSASGSQHKSNCAGIRLLRDIEALIDQLDAKCEHADVGEGPRLPVLHGSLATRVCFACARWVTVDDYNKPYKPAIRWRDPAELVIENTDGIL